MRAFNKKKLSKDKDRLLVAEKILLLVNIQIKELQYNFKN